MLSMLRIQQILPLWGLYSRRERNNNTKEGWHKSSRAGSDVLGGGGGWEGLFEGNLSKDWHVERADIHRQEDGVGGSFPSQRKNTCKDLEKKSLFGCF